MREKTADGHQVDVEAFLEDIKTVVRDGQELLRASLGSVKERARVGAEKTNTFVREKPYYSIGTAFGLGLLAGLLVATLVRRKSEEEEEED